MDHDDVQEQAEAEYRSRFPDHFAAFADLADPDDTLTDATPQQASPQATSQAQAASSHAQALLKGSFLHQIVQLHMRLYCVTQPTAHTAEESWGDGFQRAYDLGASIVEAQPQQPVGHCSAEAAALGHLLRACIDHEKLWPSKSQATQGE